LGVNSGTVTITAASENGRSASCTVSVTAAGSESAEVLLEKSAETVKVNETVKLTAWVVPTSAYDKTLSWASSNTNVATVDRNGNVRGVYQGSATITATAANGKYARCTVTVTSAGVAVTGITISGSSASSVEVGKYLTLTATVSPSNATDKTITWSSSNTNRAVVAEGRVLGISTGSVTITATAVNGVKATYSITIIAAGSTTVTATGISLNQGSVSLEAGKTLVLTATVTPSSATDKTVTWYSSDSSVATVNQSGIVQGKVPGYTTITAYNSNNNYAQCVVYVSAAEEPYSDVSIYPARTIKVGESITISTSIPSPVWSSSDDTVASVASGTIKGIKVGGTIITVRSSDKKTYVHFIVLVEAK
jgi:uncharacterized protein YjdB